MPDARVDPDRAPEPTPQNLCLDAGYDTPAMSELAREHGYTPHIRSRGGDRGKGAQPRLARAALVVERTHSWLNRFRGRSCAGPRRPTTIARSTTCLRHHRVADGP